MQPVVPRADAVQTLHAIISRKHINLSIMYVLYFYFLPPSRPFPFFTLSPCTVFQVRLATAGKLDAEQALSALVNACAVVQDSSVKYQSLKPRPPLLLVLIKTA